MFCHSCGTQVNTDVQFCPNCGYPSPEVRRPLRAPPYVAGAGRPRVPGSWIGAGWDMVKADMGNYVLIGLVFLCLNSLVRAILQGPLMAGFQHPLHPSACWAAGRSWPTSLRASTSSYPRWWLSWSSGCSPLLARCSASSPAWWSGRCTSSLTCCSSTSAWTSGRRCRPATPWCKQRLFRFHHVPAPHDSGQPAAPLGPSWGSWSPSRSRSSCAHGGLQ